MSYTLKNMIWNQREINPESTALISNRSSLNYGELDKMSNQFARILKDAGCKKGDRVCLVMDKSIEAVVSLIGSIKAGAVYIPVSSKTNIQTFKKLIKEGKVSWIIANMGSGKHLLSIMKKLQNTGDQVSIGWMGREDVLSREINPEFILKNLENYSSREFEIKPNKADPLFIQFRQNENRKLEGIVFTHQNLMDCSEWMTTYFNIKKNDKVCSAIQFHLAHFCLDLFGTLSTGACLDLVPDWMINRPELLAQKIEREKKTHAIVFPSFLEYLDKEKCLTEYNFSSLRHLMFWDKISARKVIDYCMLNMNGTTITNLYSTLKRTRKKYLSDFNNTDNCIKQRIPKMNGGEIDEEVFVFGDDLAPITDTESTIMRLKHIELKLKYWTAANGHNGEQIKAPNPFRLDFYN